MNSIIRSIIYIIWLKIRHPDIKIKGSHSIRPGTEIIKKDGGSISIGKGVATQKRVTLSAVGGRLSIGDRTIFNRNNIIVCHDTITIGNDCAFGPNVVIYDHDHKFDYHCYSKTDYKSSPIVIEDNCWIGANVTILRGTYIGKGSVIGAGCIIKESIPPHSLVKPNNNTLISQIIDRTTKKE